MDDLFASIYQYFNTIYIYTTYVAIVWKRKYKQTVEALNNRGKKTTTATTRSEKKRRKKLMEIRIGKIMEIRREWESNRKETKDWTFVYI